MIDPYIPIYSFKNISYIYQIIFIHFDLFYKNI